MHVINKSQNCILEILPHSGDFTSFAERFFENAGDFEILLTSKIAHFFIKSKAHFLEFPA